MSGLIPREFIDDLLVRVDIVDLIDSYVPLKKTGSNFMARCPFHSEKTPSFSVSRKKQFYHCFGCGASGNAISFLMDYNHLDFIEAVEDLATFIGVDVPREKNNTSQPRQDFSALYQLLEQVARFYQATLTSPEGTQASTYLRQRGIGEEISQRYQLGFALDRWDELSKHFNPKSLFESGMLTENDNGHRYDRFRNRLMFPIHDRRGRIIGFGGRVLNDSKPKYLNSPETPIFSKSNELYGLHQALSCQNHPERFVIVEGYMDVIALAEHGIDYAVATLGTSTSQKHIETLFRFSNELVLCFDGDSAGQNAAWRALEAIFPALKDNRLIKIMLLPEKEDPDSLVSQHGRQHFQQLLENATPLSEYFFNTLKKDNDLSSAEGKAMLAAKIKPYLKLLPDGFFREMMTAEAKKLTGSQKLVKPEKSPTLKKKPLSRPSPIRVVIALLLQNPQLANLIEEKNLAWEQLNLPGIQLLRDIFEKIRIKPSINTALLLEMYRQSEHAGTVQKLAGLELVGSNIEEELSQALDNIIQQATEKQLSELLEKGKQEKLTDEEKQHLRHLLTQKSGL
jgi:DNA primase